MVRSQGTKFMQAHFYNLHQIVGRWWKKNDYNSQKLLQKKNSILNIQVSQVGDNHFIEKYCFHFFLEKINYS